MFAMPRSQNNEQFQDAARAALSQAYQQQRIDPPAGGQQRQSKKKKTQLAAAAAADLDDQLEQRRKDQQAMINYATHFSFHTTFTTEDGTVVVLLSSRTHSITSSRTVV
jgi:hypothetical protein